MAARLGVGGGPGVLVGAGGAPGVGAAGLDVLGAHDGLLGVGAPAGAAAAAAQARTAVRVGWSWRCAEVGVEGRQLGEKLSEADAEMARLDVEVFKGVVLWDGQPVFVEFVDDAQVDGWRKSRALSDARILRIKTQHGKRYREFRDSVADMNEIEFSDWPLRGPRTASWCLTFLAQQPGGAAEHHVLWRRAANLATTDFGVLEHEANMESVKQAMHFDQVDLSNSAG
jgi:hypothetical protein